MFSCSSGVSGKSIVDEGCSVKELFWEFCCEGWLFWVIGYWEIMSEFAGRDSMESLLGNCDKANGGDGGEKGTTVSLGLNEMVL